MDLESRRKPSRQEDVYACARAVLFTHSCICMHSKILSQFPWDLSVGQHISSFCNSDGDGFPFCPPCHSPLFLTICGRWNSWGGRVKKEYAAGHDAPLRGSKCRSACLFSDVPRYSLKYGRTPQARPMSRPVFIFRGDRRWSGASARQKRLPAHESP